MVVRKHTVGRETNVCIIPTVLYVDTTISSEHLKELKELTKNILENPSNFEPYNNNLAGNLEKEFVLSNGRKIIEPYLTSLVKSYLKQCDTKVKNLKLEFSDAWVNFQKKYEFNPIHCHSGQYSYVLWVQIPYDLEEEISLSNCMNSNFPMNSFFSFSFTDFLGKLVDERLPVDKSWEGRIILFPAKLHHQVYPFYTSDDYRISISGNIKIMPHQKNTFDYG